MRKIFHRGPGDPKDPASGEPLTAPNQYITVDASALDSFFVAPKLLRDAGFTAWFIVGIVLVACSLVGLLALTATIVMPVLVATIIAAVTAPLVSKLSSRGVPRIGGAIFVLLIIVAIVIGVSYAVIAGILSDSAQISKQLNAAVSQVTDWLGKHGVDQKQADKLGSSTSESTADAAQSFLNGFTQAISIATGIAIFLAFMFLSLVFLLKDGPMIRAWGERRMGVPQPVARIITGRLIGSMRGYFFGVTIVAAFNSIVVGLSAWALNVPLVGTIMVVTFVGAYIPYIGAWAAGAFAVLIALGTGDQTAVIGMLVMVLLANGILQQLVQPIAYGAALGIHPLAVLIVTIGAGCLFGGVGLILGAPVTSAIVRISADLAAAKAAEGGGADPHSVAPSDPLPLPS